MSFEETGVKTESDLDLQIFIENSCDEKPVLLPISHGGLPNVSKLEESFGVEHSQLAKYLDHSLVSGGHLNLKYNVHDFSTVIKIAKII